MLHFKKPRDETLFFNAINTKDFLTLNRWKEWGWLSAWINYGTSFFNESSLMYAARIGDKEFFNYILKVEGVDINLANPENNTALSVAIKAGHLDIILSLLSRPEIKVSIPDVDLAIALKKMEIATYLFQFLMEVASENNDLDLMIILATHPLFNSCLNNIIFSSLKSALQVAIANEHIKIIEFLLSLPALNINTLSPKGETALYLAARTGNKKIVEKLLSVEGIQLYFSAAQTARLNEHHEIAARLTKLIIMPEPHMRVAYAEQKSFFLGWRNNLGYFTPVFTDWVNTIHPQLQRTPLMISAEEGDINLVNTLLKVPGIDVNIMIEKKSALLFATAANKLECVRQLLQIPELAIDRDAKIALELAQNKNFHQIYSLLKKAVLSISTNIERLTVLKYEGTIPPDFICPISMDIFNDPITLSSGHTFDRESLVKCAENKSQFQCPLTKKWIPSTELNFGTNIIIKNQIEAFIEKLEKKAEVNNHFPIVETFFNPNKKRKRSENSTIFDSNAEEKGYTSC